MKGIIHVMGSHDVGKTTFALESGAAPEGTCFFDSDVKGRATVEQVGLGSFGRYIDLNQIAEGKREIGFLEACLEEIDRIEKDQFSTIIWDTWGRFGKCFHPYVVANPGEFRAKWNSSGKIKGAEMWQEAQQYEARVLNRLSKLAPTIIVVSHLKDFYLNNAKVPGKQVPNASRTLARVPSFRIWLKHNPNSPVPIGLVLKRVDEKRFVEGKGLRTTCILPRKITPNVRLPEEVEDSHDQSLWDTIARYYAHPFNSREPMDEEKPNEFELSILDGTLTPEMKHMLNLMLEAGAVSREGEEFAEGVSGEAAPAMWSELLEMTGKTLDDLGGLGAAQAMTAGQIQEKWEEWNDQT